jgi:putative FmdB family regulatory protein
VETTLFSSPMPTYEYRCQNGHDFEVFQRMSEPPVEKCIHCGAAAERKLSAGAGLLFKGSGFYITDYRSDTYKKAAEAEKGGGSSASSTKSDSSSSSSSTSKPSSGSE